MVDTELVPLTELDKKTKISILEALDYGSDGTYVLTKGGKRYKEIYDNKPVKLDEMLIMPGSTKIIRNDPFSIIKYLDEYGSFLK